jgi:mono/diheme cytochrome c family protein
MPLLNYAKGHASAADKPWAGAWLLTLALSGSLGLGSAAAQSETEQAVERGRYLVQASGCNDCHTAGYPEAAGQIDERLWLTGSPLGWRGPWGTTYASNLRQVVQPLNEQQWLTHARAPRRPPMPWFNLRTMSDADLTAIYHYLRHLGAAGSAMPAYVPADQEPQGPYVQFPAAP